VLAYEMAHGLSHRVVQRAKAQGGCRWIGVGTDVPGYWNSGYNAKGVLFWFWDTKHVYECNGRKVLCGNFVRFTQPRSHVITGIVVMVRSFGRFRATVNVKASAKATDWCGSASASAKAKATVSGRTKLQARGNARLLASVKASLRASAKASAQVNCGAKPTPSGSSPPPSVTVTTTVINNNQQQQNQGQQQQQCQVGFVWNASSGRCEQQQTQTQVVCQNGQVVISVDQCPVVTPTPTPTSRPSASWTGWNEACRRSPCEATTGRPVLRTSRSRSWIHASPAVSSSAPAAGVTWVRRSSASKRTRPVAAEGAISWSRA